MAWRRAWTIRAFAVTITRSRCWIVREKWRGPKISAGIQNVFEWIKAAWIGCDWTSVEQLGLNNINSRPEHGILRRHYSKSAGQYPTKYSYKNKYSKTYNPMSFKTCKHHGLLLRTVQFLFENLRLRPEKEPECR